MPDLGDKLVAHGAIDPSQLESARSHQRNYGGRLEEILVEQRMVSESPLADAIAEVTGCRRIRLDDIQPEGAARAKLPVSAAEENVAFPCALRDDGRTLWVAVTDPTDLTALDGIAGRSGCRIRAMVAGAREIRRAIQRHYHGVEEAAPAEEAVASGAEGFKITDISGNTVMTSMESLREQHDAAQARRAPAPPVADEDPADALFDIQALSPDEVARLEKVRSHQEKSAIVLRALVELLEEKGVFAPGEAAARDE
jgi:hypothetical protein